MNQDDARDPTYVMGRSEDEARRLQERAEFFARPTRLLFEDAGITTGMKVLDIGSGPGDVALLAAVTEGRRAGRTPSGRITLLSFTARPHGRNQRGARQLLEKIYATCGEVGERDSICSGRVRCRRPWG